MHATRASAMLGLLLACLSTSGCFSLLALTLPHETVTGKVTTERGKVVVDSEPTGATVSEDGVVVGTTPATLDLTYELQEREPRFKHCWLLSLAGLVDLAAGAAGVWGSYGLYKSRDPGLVIGNKRRDLGLGGMIISGVYGAFGSVFLVGPPIFGCSAGKAESVVVPREHRLLLAKDRWQEPLVVRVPLGKGSGRVSTVISEMEQADWQRTDQLQTVAAYDEYLGKYPSGRWRKEAKEGLAWQEAKQDNTVAAYWKYLTEYPLGRWGNLAERALESIFKDAPDRIAEDSLSAMLFGEKEIWRSQALDELIRRHASGAIEKVLSNVDVQALRRQRLVEDLGRLGDSSQHPGQATIARKVLCDFASSSSPTGLPENECKPYRRGEGGEGYDSKPRYYPFTIRPNFSYTMCAPGAQSLGGCTRYIEGGSRTPSMEEQARAWEAAGEKCERDAMERLRIQETGLREAAAGAGACQGPK